jgi:hypothetical protein
MLSLARRMFVSSALVACVFAGASGEAGAQPSSSSFTGQRLGRSYYGLEVKVVSEVGSFAGYDDRLQAIAVARMANADPAVVVKGRDNKWHALVTTANAFGGLAAADNMNVRGLVALPSVKAIAGAKRTESDESYFATVLGLDRKEVQTTYTSKNREARFVNVNSKLPYPGMHGAEKMEGEEFKLGVLTAIELRRSLFDGPDPRAAANVVLFHEATHRADYDLAQTWAQKFSNAKGDFKNAETFLPWLFKQGLSKDDAQTVADVVVKAHGSTEARAYVGAFIAAMQTGAYDAAQDELVTYARGLGKRIDLPTSEIVPTALRADLDRCYRSLDANGKKRFDAAFTAAKTAAPSAWISKFERGGGRRS